MMTSFLQILTGSLEETQKAGQVLGEQAQPGDIFLLTGPLGAGKTSLTQGIARGLGVAGYARSPTFVLATRYQGRLTLHHVDLYRIDDPIEAWDLGLEELLAGDDVCVVEWADRAEEIFPEDSLWITLDYAPGENQRTLTFEKRSTRYFEMLEKLAQVFPTAKEVNP
jgi:tRNA threonylcarbamoyladenosine biosynthesis protein TsaE